MQLLPILTIVCVLLALTLSAEAAKKQKKVDNYKRKGRGGPDTDLSDLHMQMAKLKEQGRDADAEEVKKSIDEYMRSSMLDTDELDPNYKPVSHEERTANEKQKNKEQREEKKAMLDKVRGRINNAISMSVDRKAELLEHVDEMHEIEMALADSRLQITHDFEHVHTMEKEERRAHLDDRREKRAVQREKDNKKRDRMTELRKKVNGALDAAERGAEL